MLSLLWSVGQRFDVWLFKAINTRGARPRWMDGVMWLITQIGSVAFITPLVFPFGPKRCMMKPPGPLACKAQTVQQTKKIMEIASVMFRSALAPRSKGEATW